MYAHAPLGKSLLRSLLRPGAPARVLGLQASGDRLLIRAMASTGAQTYAMTGVASPEDRHGWPACCCHSPRQASPPGVADGVASLFLAAARRPFVSNHAATLAPRPTSLATGAGTAFSACKRRCRRPLPCLPLPSIAPTHGRPAWARVPRGNPNHPAVSLATSIIEGSLLLSVSDYCSSHQWRRLLSEHLTRSGPRGARKSGDAGWQPTAGLAGLDWSAGQASQARRCTLRLAAEAALPTRAMHTRPCGNTSWYPRSHSASLALDAASAAIMRRNAVHPHDRNLSDAPSKIASGGRVWGANPKTKVRPGTIPTTRKLVGSHGARQLAKAPTRAARLHPLVYEAYTRCDYRWSLG